MHKIHKAHLAILSANIIFGANFSAVKFIAPRMMGPFALNLTRVLIAVLLFWSLFLFKPGKAGIHKKDIPLFILCAFTGIAVNQLLFIKGLTMTSPIHASLLILATPIFVTIIAVVLAHEKLTVYKVLGLLFGIGGAAMLVVSKESAPVGSNMLLGDILVTINAISYSFYLVLAKPLMKRYNPLHVIRWMFTIGTFMILPFAWNEFSVVEWNTFNWIDWSVLSFVVVGATFLAYFFNTYGLYYLNASMVGAYIYTQPVYAAIISMLFFHERLTPWKIAAAVLIFVGVYLANFFAGRISFLVRKNQARTD